MNATAAGADCSEDELVKKVAERDTLALDLKAYVTRAVLKDNWRTPRQSTIEARKSFVEALLARELKVKDEKITVMESLDFRRSRHFDALPEGYDVEGSLILSNCFSLERLPEGLKVGGDLDLQNCKELTSLPGTLIVKGDLNLEGCSALTALPEGLSLIGSLNLCSCSALTALPEKLSVNGAMNLKGCSALTTLPEKLNLGGSLDLFKCTALTALPEELIVNGFLELGECSALKRLPTQIEVEGSLILPALPTLTTLPSILKVRDSLDASGCSALSLLPEGLNVGGFLDLKECSSLSALPEGLRVGQDLDLSGCCALTKLPARLDVGGTLDLSGCTALTALPHELSIGQDLYLPGCVALCTVPESFHVKGSLILDSWIDLVTLPKWLIRDGASNFGWFTSLKLRNCSALTALPDGLNVDGDLYLSDCSSLASLPEGLDVGGDLTLERCLSLTTLPKGLNVEGSLDLDGCSSLTAVRGELKVECDFSLVGCSSLTALPEGLIVRRHLNLVGCSSLTALPEGLEVGRDLTLEKCLSLTMLPEGLNVEGSLNIGNCSSLTSLPEGLDVGGNLNLTNCSELVSVPADFSVGADLNLEGCVSLESLPSSILAWPKPNGATSFNSVHYVYLERSGLSQETLEWLRAADAQNVRFHVSLPTFEVSASENTQRFMSVSDAVGFWMQESRDSTTLVPKQVKFSRAEEHILLRFLSKLRGAKEFGITETRHALARRVTKVLERLNNAECQVEMFQRMADSLDACHDKPIWALNQLTLVGLISIARGDRSKLFKLGRRVMHLQIVHKHVQKKIASLKCVDDVCVYLRFEIELRETLELPVQATSMLFPNYIDISDAELRAAEREALEVTQEAFEVWLTTWAEWERQARFEAAESLRWEDLDIDQSICASQVPLTNLYGEAIVDPIVLRRQVWSLSDLLRHWIQTGSDLMNVALRKEEIDFQMKRVPINKKLSC
mmetsp:Transcript_8380/g.15388  ORF Transcript_8380/g.15388 Transcript_8380/m.15388 type:complete len:963 (+) Transcript_8380:57-2945(+)